MRLAGPVLVALLAACASAPPETSRPASVPPPDAATVTEEAPLPLPDRPALADVLRLAADAPRVRAAHEGLSVARGEREQAELWPNPVLGVRADRIDLDDVGDGPNRWKFGLRERIETAGKRDARTEVAAAGVLVSQEEIRAETVRTALDAATLHQRAVSSALLAAARRETLTATEALVDLRRASVEAGRAPAAVLPDLQARLGKRRIEIVQEEERGRRALRALEGVLGVPTGSFAGASGEPLHGLDLPDPSAESTRAAVLEGNPECARLRAEARRAGEATREARAKAWPDVTVGLDVEDEESRTEKHDRMQLLGLFVEWPLPVFDRRPGAIAAAVAEERRIAARATEAGARHVAAYAETHEAIEARRASLVLWRDEILPARERDLTLTRAAFEGGRSDRVAVLEARVALAEAIVEAAKLEESLATLQLEALALLGRDPVDWIR